MPDAWVCTPEDGNQPITAAGASPAGPLDVFRYGLAVYQDCGRVNPGAYEIVLSTTGLPQNCEGVQSVSLWVTFPNDGTQSASGTFAAYASIATFPNDPISTSAVTFEATRIDPPFGTAPQVTGRFHAASDGWSFDVDVDVTSRGSQTVCDI